MFPKRCSTRPNFVLKVSDVEGLSWLIDHSFELTCWKEFSGAKRVIGMHQCVGGDSFARDSCPFLKIID